LYSAANPAFEFAVQNPRRTYDASAVIEEEHGYELPAARLDDNANDPVGF
jgi:hypothetical protein